MSGTDVPSETVTATYSDRVALIGNQPVGDIYARLHVEFNQAIGINERVVFRNDLDSTSSQIVPSGIPFDFSIFRGVFVDGGLFEIQQSDDFYLRLNPGFTINDLEAPVWLIFDGTAPDASGIQLESQAGTLGLSYTVETFNWVANSYDVIDTRDESFNSDQVANFPIVPNDHIDANGSVRSRIGWRQTGFTINFPWEVRVDQVGWAVN